MDKVRLGRTELMVSASGFGAIPIQRISFDDAKAILRRAYDGGINYYDTARGYTDSEEKIGYALSDVRHDIIIASKTAAVPEREFFNNLETSLRNMKTDYIDVYQLHNPSFMPDEESEAYQCMLKAKQQGKIRFISITNHRLDLAKQMVESGLYDTMQFPVSAISNDEDFELVTLCKDRDVGFIAMKGMAGGLLTDPTATFAKLRQYGNIVPIWGIQHLWELEQFLKLEQNPPELTDELLEVIAKDKAELSGNFCRACGYCMPTCPVGIQISMAARMSLMLRRASVPQFTTPEWKANMLNVENCIECGECAKHCPYNLDTPALIKRELEFYRKYL